MPWITARPADFIATLEKSGEAEVQAALARKDPWVTHAGRVPVVEAWLRSKVDERAANAALRSELRSEREIAISSKANVLVAEANRLAAEANTIARRAERWAMWAVIVAVTSTVVAVLK